MRHFCAAPDHVPLLAPGVVDGTGEGPLVPSACTPQRLRTPRRRALLRAINVCPIAPAADLGLSEACGAVEKPVGFLDHRDRSQGLDTGRDRGNVPGGNIDHRDDPGGSGVLDLGLHYLSGVPYLSRIGSCNLRNSPQESGAVSRYPATMRGFCPSSTPRPKRDPRHGHFGPRRRSGEVPARSLCRRPSRLYGAKFVYVSQRSLG